MGDHRASIKIKMEAHGKTYDADMWINWSPEHDGCDRRIKEWFAACWEDAYARYHEAEYEAKAAEREAAEAARQAALAKLTPEDREALGLRVERSA